MKVIKQDNQTTEFEVLKSKQHTPTPLELPIEKVRNLNTYIERLENSNDKLKRDNEALLMAVKTARTFLDECEGVQGLADRLDKIIAQATEKGE